MSPKVAAAVAVIAVAALAGFGAAQLGHADPGSPGGDLRAAKARLTSFEPPAVGTTTVPALRVRRPVKRAVKHATPAAPRTATSNPTVTAPRAVPTAAPPRSTTPQPKTRKPSGPVDTIGGTEGGED